MMSYYFLWLRWYYYELVGYEQHPLNSDHGYVDLRSLQRKWITSDSEWREDNGE